MGSAAVTESEVAGGEMQRFVRKYVTGPGTCAAREHDGVDVVSLVDSGLGTNELGVARSAVWVVSARHVHLDVAETMLGQMSLERGESFGGFHVGNEPHIDFGDSAVGKNGFAPGSGIAADQAFNIYGGARLQQFKRFLPAPIVEPVIDAHLFLGHGFVESLGGGSDHRLIGCRE